MEGVAIHESLRLYSVCKLFKFNYLPVAGGLYDQHPRLLEDFLMIAQIEARAERRRQEKREREMAQKQGRSASRGRRRGRH